MTSRQRQLSGVYWRFSRAFCVGGIVLLAFAAVLPTFAAPTGLHIGILLVFGLLLLVYSVGLRYMSRARLRDGLDDE